MLISEKCLKCLENIRKVQWRKTVKENRIVYNMAFIILPKNENNIFSNFCDNSLMVTWLLNHCFSLEYIANFLSKLCLNIRKYFFIVGFRQFCYVNYFSFFVKGFVDAWDIDTKERKDICDVIDIKGTLAFELLKLFPECLQQLFIKGRLCHSILWLWAKFPTSTGVLVSSQNIVMSLQMRHSHLPDLFVFYVVFHTLE